MCSPRREPLGPLPFDFPDLCISTELPLFVLFIYLFGLHARLTQKPPASPRPRAVSSPYRWHGPEHPRPTRPASRNLQKFGNRGSRRTAEPRGQAAAGPGGARREPRWP